MADDVQRLREDGTLVVVAPGDGELDPGRVLGERAVDGAADGHVLHRRGDQRDAEAGGDEAHERGGLGDLVGGPGLEAVGRAGVLDGVVHDRA